MFYFSIIFSLENVKKIKQHQIKSITTGTTMVITNENIIDDESPLDSSDNFYKFYHNVSPRVESEYIHNKSFTEIPSKSCKEKECSQNRSFSEIPNISLQLSGISKKSKSIRKENYSYKNLPKIIGNSISTSIWTGKFKNKEIFLELLEKTGISHQVFRNWMKENQKITHLVNLSGFRNLFIGDINYLLASLDQRCKYVFRSLIIWFLENEIYNCFIFGKTFPKVKKDIYLKRIPKFLDGLKNPDSFFNLK